MLTGGLIGFWFVLLAMFIARVVVLPAIEKVKTKRGITTGKGKTTQADKIRELEMDPWVRNGSWEKEMEKQIIDGQKQYHKDYSHLEVCGCGLPWCGTDKPEGWLDYCKNNGMGEKHDYSYDGECYNCHHRDYTKGTEYRIRERNRVRELEQAKKYEEDKRNKAEIARYEREAALVKRQMEALKPTVDDIDESYLEIDGRGYIVNKHYSRKATTNFDRYDHNYYKYNG